MAFHFMSKNMPIIASMCALGFFWKQKWFWFSVQTLKGFWSSVKQIKCFWWQVKKKIDWLSGQYLRIPNKKIVVKQKNINNSYSKLIITLFTWDLELIAIGLAVMWTQAKGVKSIPNRFGPNLLASRFKIGLEPIWGYKLTCERFSDLKSIWV